MDVARVTQDGDDPVKAWLRSNVPHVVRELFAGGAAGAVAKTCVAPLERTKILIMTGRSNSSAFTTLRLIITTEGFQGLFRGNGASCLRIMPYASIHFSVYESYRRLLAEHFFPRPQTPRTVATTASTEATNVRRSIASTTDPSTATAVVVTSSSGSDDGNIGGGSHDGVRTIGTQHLGEDVPPTPMTSSIEVSATAVITSVEEEQREEDALPAGTETVAAAAASLLPPSPPVAAQQPQWHRDDAAAQRRRRPGPLIDLVAGSAAGATAVLLTYPLDMVRTRLAWGMDGAPKTATRVAPVVSTASAVLLAAPPPAHHTRIGAMLLHTARHEGVVGLYRGLAPTLYGIMPYAGLKFYVYGSLKQWYRDTLQPHSLLASATGSAKGGGGGSGERLPVLYMLAFGGTSGLLAQTVTYPLDVIRRRMQVFGIQREAGVATALGESSSRQSTPPLCRERLTTWTIASAIVRQDGFRGLFRGLSLNYVKVVPSTAIGFTVYDMLKSYLGVTGNM